MSANRTPPGDQSGERVRELVAIMRRLLAPGGCPWDREQTLETLRPFLVEETYEVLEALESGDASAHCEELGDLLLQVVFQAELRAGAGVFGIDDVAAAICDKLVRRHPHVFGDARADTSAEVLANWGRIKRGEKSGEAARTLAGVPRALPALLRATRLTQKAAGVGFDWPDAAGARAKVDEELGEADRAAGEGRDAQFRELGDALFAMVNWARKLGVDPEDALRAACERFTGRFAQVEDRLAARGRKPGESTLAEMDALWDEVKREGG